MNTSKGSITPARFQDVNRLALSRVEGVLAHWLPGGVIKNGEYIVKNPARDDRNAGSFSVNLNTG